MCTNRHLSVYYKSHENSIHSSCLIPVLDQSFRLDSDVNQSVMMIAKIIVIKRHPMMHPFIQHDHPQNALSISLKRQIQMKVHLQACFCLYQCKTVRSIYCTYWSSSSTLDSEVLVESGRINSRAVQLDDRGDSTVVMSFLTDGKRVGCLKEIRGASIWNESDKNRSQARMRNFQCHTDTFLQQIYRI